MKYDRNRDLEAMKASAASALVASAGEPKRLPKTVPCPCCIAAGQKALRATFRREAEVANEIGRCKRGHLFYRLPNGALTL